MRYIYQIDGENFIANLSSGTEMRFALIYTFDDVDS